MFTIYISQTQYNIILLNIIIQLKANSLIIL